MDADGGAIPDDIAALKEALASERAKALEVAAELAVARAKASEDGALIAQQKLRIAKLERQIYGQGSERSSRLIDQLALTFEELEASPYFSHGQLLCDGDRRIWRRRRGAVALKALATIWLFCVCPLDLVDDAADWARGGGACQAGEARALAASARRRAAQPHSSAAGQAEAMAILMRRQEMRTSAPIFKSLSLMVPQVASAKVVSARPMRRRAQIST